MPPWRVLDFAIAFGVARHIDVGLARGLLGYVLFCVLCRPGVGGTGVTVSAADEVAHWRWRARRTLRAEAHSLNGAAASIEGKDEPQKEDGGWGNV